MKGNSYGKSKNVTKMIQFRFTKLTCIAYILFIITLSQIQPVNSIQINSNNTFKQKLIEAYQRNLYHDFMVMEKKKSKDALDKSK